LNSIDIAHLNKVTSTNDFSIDLIKNNISINGIVISDTQTKGRGRYGNSWISLKGNIFCSLYKKVRNHKNIYDAQFTSLKIVKKYLVKIGIKDKHIKIKKPNDILVNHKKICGILIESIRHKKNLYLIVGIGLNVIRSPKIKCKKTTFLKKHLLKNSKKLSFVNFIKQNIKHF
tara:strand:- start:19855 stop:20373 length:519 start_codon:yes stop_codon:yes gene_type:complete